MNKTAELSLRDRMAEITGAAVKPTEKVAGLAYAHAEPTTDEVIEKVASMDLSEMINNDHFIAGFERRVAERMPEIDAAVDAAVGN